MRHLILFLCLPLAAQVSASRTATMRYNDQTGTTGRFIGATATWGGDTWHCSHSASSLYYCTYNDGNGVSGISSRNIGTVTFSLDLSNVNNTVATFVDGTANFGGATAINTNGWANNTSFKSGGIEFYNSGKLYLATFQQCKDSSGAVCTGLPQFSSLNETIHVSDDLMVHWCNPKTWAANSNSCPHNATTAGGDPPQGPTADSAIMWPGGTHMGYMQWVQFNSGDSTDANATYVYAISTSTDFKSFYLSRVPVASILDVTAWNYYKGPAGGDVNNSSNWCTSNYSTCEASQTVIAQGSSLVAVANAAGVGDTPTMVHLPSPWNCYLMQAAWADVNGIYRNRLYWAPSMTGPFTPIALDAILGGGGQNFPQALLDTLTVTSASQKTGTIALISGGPCCNAFGSDYSPFWSTYAIGPGSPATGFRFSAPGTALQTTSKIRLSSGLIPNAFPNRGMVQLWLFNDQVQLPTLWPAVTNTEQLTGATCTITAAVTLSAIGMNFPGTGNNSGSASRCTTSTNSPSALQGDGTYTVWAVFKASTAASSSILGTGVAATRNQLLITTTQSTTGDVYVGNYGSDIAWGNSTLITSGSNYYFMAVSKSAGQANQARVRLYFSGKSIVFAQNLAAPTSAPNVTAAVIQLGATVGTSGNFSAPLNGTLVAVGIHNVILTPAEVRHIYTAAKFMLARRGATLQ